METTIETFDSVKAHEAQKKWCKENNFPHFAPTQMCWKCHKDIYSQIDRGTFKTGISVERAGRTGITGCPHCSYSYCD